MNSDVDGRSPPPVWLIVTLASVTATGPASMQMFLPALPEVQHSYAVDPGVAQLTISASMIAVALSTLIYGPLSDRLGRKPVLVAGLVVFFVGSVACALAPDIDTLIVGRIVQGAGGAAGLVLARAVARDVYGPSQAAGVIAQLSMIMVIAPMVAPLIGGAVNDAFHWRGIFVVIAIAGLATLFASLRLPETHRERGVAESPIDILRGFGMLLTSARFCVLASFPAFSSMVFFSFVSGAPYVMVRLLERPATEYGLYFMVVVAGFMLGNLLTIRVGGRLALMQLMMIGACVMTVGVALLAAFIACNWLNPLTLFLPIALSQVGQGIALPNAQAAVINLVPHRAGTASSVTGFLQMVAAAAASQLVGTLQNGTAWPLAAMMGIGAVGALTVMFAARTMPRRTKS